MEKSKLRTLCRLFPYQLRTIPILLLLFYSIFELEEIFILVFTFFQTWIDIKKHTKSKITKNRKEQFATGGGVPDIERMNDLDSTVLEIMTPITITGDSEIPQPSIEFDFSSPHSSVEYPVPQPSVDFQFSSVSV